MADNIQTVGSVAAKMESWMILAQATVMGSKLKIQHCNLGKPVVVHRPRTVDILIYSWSVVEQQQQRRRRLAVAVENLVAVCTFQIVVEGEEGAEEVVAVDYLKSWGFRVVPLTRCHFQVAGSVDDDDGGDDGVAAAVVSDLFRTCPFRKDPFFQDE